MQENFKQVKAEIIEKYELEISSLKSVNHKLQDQAAEGHRVKQVLEKKENELRIANTRIKDLQSRLELTELQVDKENISANQ